MANTSLIAVNPIPLRHSLSILMTVATITQCSTNLIANRKFPIRYLVWSGGLPIYKESLIIQPGQPYTQQKVESDIHYTYGKSKGLPGELISSAKVIHFSILIQKSMKIGAQI